ncbi:HAD hydrolase family protein [Psychrobacter sp. I-STPA6b]|uniref:HAD hydrolase family protein n=1 Tax=Psychrobacter sp. I-STPA6b TaxID=2585718 RepID=UPI001D0C8903|nr:HAD hydrolase family protein [Psychrobacter sp. I-STPA6b]
MNTYFFPSIDTLHTPVKPYALMDLDDTLFQTQRKIDAWQLPTAEPETLVCATVNKQGQPLSFMSKRQAHFFHWLYTSTELIAVTARDSDEIKRVKLPFNSWQVLTHGAVIVEPDGKLHPQWQKHMLTQLTPLQDMLAQLIQQVEQLNQIESLNLKLAIHRQLFTSAPDKDVIIYLAIKHTQKDHQALAKFAERLPSLFPQLSDNFYIHVNANNLAILPHVVHKRHAVAFLLQHCLETERPSFGFGDSLADLPFLQLLDWYGTPNHGQLHKQIDAKIGL